MDLRTVVVVVVVVEISLKNSLGVINYSGAGAPDGNSHAQTHWP